MYGVKYVCDAFIPLLSSDGRIVNVSSELGVGYVRMCSKDHKKFFTNTEVTWNQIE